MSTHANSKKRLCVLEKPIAATTLWNGLLIITLLFILIMGITLLMSLRGVGARERVASISIGLITGIIAAASSVTLVYAVGIPDGDTAVGTALRGYAVFAVISILTCAIARVAVELFRGHYPAGIVVSMALIVSSFVSLSELLLTINF